MSTRANIRINDKDGNRIMLYHHNDGGPDWLGRRLEMICRSGIFRHMNANAIATYLIKGNFKNAEERLRKNEIETEILEEKPYGLGFELTNDWHGDIDYAYTIRREGKSTRLKCYKVKKVIYDEDKERSRVQYNKIEMDLQYEAEEDYI
jgi:hypothetical protein